MHSDGPEERDAWRKYRAEFEAYLPDADGKTADEIAELDGRRSFMDPAEEHQPGHGL